MKEVKTERHSADAKLEGFAFCHPLTADILIFFGMPLVMLLGIGLSTLLVVYPIAWMFGWL